MTTADIPSGPSDGNGVSGTVHDNGAQSAGAGPANNPTVTVTVSALDGNVGRPDGGNRQGHPVGISPSDTTTTPTVVVHEPDIRPQFL